MASLGEHLHLSLLRQNAQFQLQWTISVHRTCMQKIWRLEQIIHLLSLRQKQLRKQSPKRSEDQMFQSQLYLFKDFKKFTFSNFGSASFPQLMIFMPFMACRIPSLLIVIVRTLIKQEQSSIPKPAIKVRPIPPSALMIPQHGLSDLDRNLQCQKSNLQLQSH